MSKSRADTIEDCTPVTSGEAVLNIDTHFGHEIVPMNAIVVVVVVIALKSVSKWCH